ncbi:MAG TPA: histidine kinase [Solirubrobacteraceae bacterium]|nr:histidine kinase [Solirubrobacteraceae bacterium]
MRHTGARHLPGRVRQLGPAQVDPGLAIGVLWILAVLVVDNSSHAHVAVIPAALHNTAARWLVDVGAIAVALVALALRHRQPLVALFVIVAAVLAAPAVLLLLGPALVALYTVASALGRRDAAIAAVAVVAAFVLQRVAWGPSGDNSPATVLIGTIASAGLGLYAGVSRESARERTAFELREEVLEAERTAADERVRIARELHDVVAHTLSLIIVQSEVMRTKLTDEEQRNSAAAIAELGRDAMAELHRTLELLRGGDQLAERAPRPVLSDLQQLVAQSRGGGLDVELGVEGAVRSLPASFELCAYRIVQEALTNVRRHAGAAHATVRLRFGTDALEVSIEDDGAGATAAAESAGHGLRGMRERAAMLGGAVNAGPRDHDGYCVSATLPYPEPL